MKSRIEALSRPRADPETDAGGRAGALRPDRSVLFPVLVALAVANGLAAKIVLSVETGGPALALVSTFGISAIVWLAVAAAIDLLRRDAVPSTDLDLVVCAFVLLTFVAPVAPMAWLGLTILSLHILRISRRDSAAWRGGWIALAVTVPMLWTPNLFKLVGTPILAADASLVSWMFGLPRDGNVVALADGSGSLFIAPACSSLANVSLAILCWVTLIRTEGLPITPRSVAWCGLGCILVIVANVVRIGLIAMRPDWYETIHGPTGAIVLGWTILALIGMAGLAAVRSGHARLA